MSTDHPTPEGELEDSGVVDDFLAGRTESLSPELGAVFTAAAGPATAKELAGADQAIATFLQAHGSQGEAAAPRRLVLPAFGRRLIGAGIAGTVVFAGFAAGAYAHVLPDPLERVADAILPGTIWTRTPPSGPTVRGNDPSVPSGSSASQGTDGSSSSGGTDRSTTSTDAATGAADPATAAAAKGLCTAWSHHGVATDSQVFLELADAAGGADHIDAYCAPFIRSATTQATTDTPTMRGSSPTAHPTLPTQAATHATGKPTSLGTKTHPTNGKSPTAG